MAYRIDSNDIFRRLGSRFLCKTRIDDATPRISEQVIPITNADDLIKTIDVKENTATVGGVGNIVGITVPQGKRWYVYAWSIVSASGTWTASSVSVNDQTNTMKIKAPAASSSTILSESNPHIVMERGWTITFYADVVGVAGTAKVSCLVAEEDVY